MLNTFNSHGTSLLDEFGRKERARIGRMTKATDLQRKVAMCRSLARGGNYRISPLVSDVETWRKRIVELGVARPRSFDHVGWKDDPLCFSSL